LAKKQAAQGVTQGVTGAREGAGVGTGSKAGTPYTPPSSLAKKQVAQAVQKALGQENKKSQCMHQKKNQSQSNNLSGVIFILQNIYNTFNFLSLIYLFFYLIIIIIQQQHNNNNNYNNIYLYFFLSFPA